MPEVRLPASNLGTFDWCCQTLRNHWNRLSWRLHTMCHAVMFAFVLVLWTLVRRLMVYLGFSRRGGNGGVCGDIGTDGGPYHLQLEADPPLISHHFVKLQDVKLYYIEAGAPSKRAPQTPADIKEGPIEGAIGSENRLLLFLHGFAETSRAWRHQLLHFGRHIHVVAVDMPGCGRSGGLPSNSLYRSENVAALLQRLIQYFDAEGRCILVASDSSALIGWSLVQMAPLCCSQFVAISQPLPHVTLASLDGSLSRKIKCWLLYLFQLPWLPEYMISHGHLDVLQREYHQLTLDGSIVESIVTYYRLSYDEHSDWHGAISAYRHLFSAENRVPPATRAISTPCLLVFGERDQMTTAGYRHNSVKHLVHGEVEVINGASSHLSQSTPDQLNELIKCFAHIQFKSVERGASSQLLGDECDTVAHTATRLVPGPRWPGLGAQVYSHTLRGIRTVRVLADMLK